MIKIDVFAHILRTSLCALLLAVASAGVAEAQYGGETVCVTSRGNCSAGYAPPGTGCYCNIPGFGRKAGAVRGYRPRPPEPYYEGRRRYRDDDDYSPYPRRVRMGSTCVTSRGSCSIGRLVPLPAGCACHIPGFGRKRGEVR